MPERTIAACSVTGCSKPQVARSWCNMHYIRWRAHGDPLKVKPANNRPMYGADNPKWKGDGAKYSAIHNRLRRYRGSAIDHSCSHCGQRAEDWAYDRTDPTPKVDPATSFPYSTDLNRYLPLCKPCHWRFDRERTLAGAR